ncbi:hypothetical protein [Niveibacterium sp.]|uniref:hypothetical protein n=1 Tax=Niveibacterium sp. TaxID=2017444 RepID=UPI0035AEF34A
MQVSIVLPGLHNDAADAASALRNTSLPGLAWLLGRAKTASIPKAGSTEAFASRFGVGNGATAVLRRAGELALPLPQADEVWLCADLVGLHFARDQMVLTAPDGLALTDTEAAALAEPLQDILREVGEYVPATAERGYLRLHERSDAIFSDLIDVAGRPVALFLPEGRGGLRWGRIINAVQIALHDQPVNRAREAAGLRAANSLWFWGESRLGTQPAHSADSIYTDNPVGAGLARLAGSAPQPLGTFAASPTCREALLLIDALDAPARFRDTWRWLEALKALEAEVFAPLATRMQRGEIARVEIAAPGERGGLALAITPQRWAFWRKPMPPEQLLAAPLPAAPGT